MGLDMYLEKRHFVGNKYRKPEEQVKVEGLEGVKQERVQEITEQVAYWRKANAIHQWFVKHVQDGVDNCGDYHVSRPELVTLRDLCKEVLADHTKAKELLPTQEGFFFGNTEYGDDYFSDISDTVKMLDEVLAEEAHGDFYYSSSW